MIYFSEIPLSDVFPRVTDDADRTGITYATHGKMIYFAHALRATGGAGRGRLSRERAQLVVWCARGARECLAF